MPPRKNRNANRFSAGNTPNLQPAKLLPELDTPSPASLAEDLPYIYGDSQGGSELTREPTPEPQMDTLGHQVDLLDMQEDSERVRGDVDYGTAYAASSPPARAFDLSDPVDVQRETSTEAYEPGHVRSPVLVHEASIMESLSRTVRSYVPSSIPIPSGTPAPPRISRPLSIGSFMSAGPPSPASPVMTATIMPKHRSSPSHDWRARNTSGGHQQSHGAAGLDEVFASDEESASAATTSPPRPFNMRSLSNASNTSYPSADAGDAILWSHWDQLREGSCTRRLLFLGYVAGLQVWDCSKLGSVVEILNLAGKDWGRVTFAGVLPSPPGKGDPYAKERPLLGLVTGSSEESMFSIYSMRTHRVIKTLGISDVHSFSSNERFTAICTTTPPSIHIINSTTLSPLHIISAATLLPFSHPVSSNTANNKSNTNNVPNVSTSISPLDTTSLFAQQATQSTTPSPVFALSNRLIAFAAAPPRPSSSGGHTTQPLPRTRPPSGTFGVNVTQADLGNAALKVGGSVLSGMKVLGGIAYSAAKARVAHTSPIERPEEGKNGLSNMFFSKSAPAASGRRISVSGPGESKTGLGQESPPEPVFLEGASPSKSGHYITVLDLASLLTHSKHNPAKPTVIAEFVASKRYPVSDIQFTADGNSLIVTPSDGRLLRVFHLRPASPTAKLAAAAIKEAGVPSEPWHVYALRRGQTAAVVEGVEGSGDGRWIAVGSRKRTVHVFAVNPYGGKADHRSHLEGRVRNVHEIPLSTQVAAIVRLRALYTPSAEQLLVPLAFTFIQSSEASLPANLLPPATYTHSAPTSVQSSPVMHAEPPSPHQLKRPTNYQDVLVFDAMDGSLSLRRFTVNSRTRDQLTLPASVGGTSISLPGASLSSRLGISPPSVGNKSSGLSQMMQAPSELVVSNSNILASWNLKRGHDWTEVHKELKFQPMISHRGLSAKSNLLAHAELSPAPKSNRLVPRTIYLSHQFFFQAFGEDYHALIRRFHLDIDGSKIDVRREVSVHAFSTGASENFVEEFSAPQDNMHTTSSSFDEPLASALSAGLDYANPFRTIPMLPNGAPKSFRNPVPIRNMTTGITDGMSDSLGRIRREMHKVRSPVLGPRSDISGSVPLEFDEEDFLDRGENHLRVREDSFSRSSNSRGDDSAASISTPSTSAAPLEDQVEDSWGWNAEDKQLVDEVEQFDDVVGFLDEEQPRSIVHKETKKGRR